jgi:hypothetical protein
MVGAMGNRPHRTDDDATRPLNHTVKLTMGAVVFVFGLLAGVAIAAWIIPPS